METEAAAKREEILYFLVLWPLACLLLPLVLAAGLPVLFAFIGPFGLYFGHNYERREPNFNCCDGEMIYYIPIFIPYAIVAFNLGFILTPIAIPFAIAAMGGLVIKEIIEYTVFFWSYYKHN